MPVGESISRGISAAIAKRAYILLIHFSIGLGGSLLLFCLVVLPHWPIPHDIAIYFAFSPFAGPFGDRMTCDDYDPLGHSWLGIPWFMVISLQFLWPNDITTFIGRVAFGAWMFLGVVFTYADVV